MESVPQDSRAGQQKGQGPSQATQAPVPTAWEATPPGPQHLLFVHKHKLCRVGGALVPPIPHSPWRAGLGLGELWKHFMGQN